LRAYLAARRVAFVEDESNADVSIPRNRVRAELLPMLQSRFNPRIVDTLAAEAELAQDTLRWIEAEADKLLVRARHPATGGLEIAALRTAPSALARFAVWRALNEAAGGRPVSFDHVQAALAVMRSPSGAARDLPGQRVERVGAALVLRSRAAGTAGRVLAKGPNFFEYPLSIPGEVVLPTVGAALIAERRPAVPEGLESAGSDGPRAIVRDDLAAGPWRVRSRYPGDRFQPVGLRGRKKLQDLFVDLKVPRDRRDQIPLVVNGSGRIVWVAGYGIDEAFRVTDPAQPVVVLRLKLLGGGS
jgi:tRNA(Ile)-lysidine synthase